VLLRRRGRDGVYGRWATSNSGTGRPGAHRRLAMSLASCAPSPAIELPLGLVLTTWPGALGTLPLRLVHEPQVAGAHSRDQFERRAERGGAVGGPGERSVELAGALLQLLGDGRRPPHAAPLHRSRCLGSGIERCSAAVELPPQRALVSSAPYRGAGRGPSTALTAASSLRPTALGPSTVPSRSCTNFLDARRLVAGP